METKMIVEFGTKEWINKMTWSLLESRNYSEIGSEIFETIKGHMSWAMFDSLKDVYLFEDKQWGNGRLKKWNINDILAEIAKSLLFKFTLKDDKVQVDEIFKFEEIYKTDNEFECYEITEEFLQGLLIMLSFKPMVQEAGCIVSFSLPEYLKEIFKIKSSLFCFFKSCYYIMLVDINIKM